MSNQVLPSLARHFPAPLFAPTPKAAKPVFEFCEEASDRTEKDSQQIGKTDLQRVVFDMGNFGMAGAPGACENIKLA